MSRHFIQLPIGSFIVKMPPAKHRRHAVSFLTTGISKRDPTQNTEYPLKIEVRTSSFLDSLFGINLFG